MSLCMLTSSLACLLCMMTSQLRHPYPGQSSGSSRLVFGSGQLIRAKTGDTRGQQPYRRVTAFPTRFSPVASSLPPLHSGMVKTQFWQLSFLSKKSNTTLNHVLWYQLLRIPAPLCTDQWCSDSCPLEAKHTNIIFNVVRQIAYIHEKGPYY
jgi:hypothetical protein